MHSIMHKKTRTRQGAPGAEGAWSGATGSLRRAIGRIWRRAILAQRNWDPSNQRPAIGCLMAGPTHTAIWLAGYFLPGLAAAHYRSSSGRASASGSLCHVASTSLSPEASTHIPTRALPLFKLISHLHHHEGQRDSQNSHHRCRPSASAAPVALPSNRRLRLANTYNTNAPAPFVSYMYVSPAACALPFVLVGTWCHIPCSNCA